MFEDWSPAQLAFALGYRIDLRSHGMTGRTAFIVRPSGRAHAVSHGRACRTMARLAKWAGIDPKNPPMSTPRALLDGKEQ